MHPYLLAAIATVAWGVVVIPLKLARIPGRLGIGISMLTGALAMWALAWPDMLGVAELAPVEILRFIVTGTVQFALGCTLYYESIRLGSVSIAVPITRVKIVAILAFSILLGLETFRWSLLGACLLVALGGVLIGRGGEPGGAEEEGKDHRKSLVLAGLACVCWSVGETLIGTLPKTVPPIAANGLLLTSGVLTYGVYSAVSGQWRDFRTVPWRDALCYVIHGLVSFSLAYVCYVKAVAVYGPPRISCITSTYPAISAIIGWVVFKEKCGVGLVVGGALLIGGVVLLQFA